MANLAVTITESVTLNGAARGSTNSLSITGVDDIYHRIITVPAANVTVATFHSTVAISDASLDVAHAKYIRVTNLDASAAIVLNLNIDINNNDGAADENVAIKVGPGESFIMGSPDASLASSGATSAGDDTGAAVIAVGALEDIESIIVTAPSEVKVEVFIASAA